MTLTVGQPQLYCRIFDSKDGSEGAIAHFFTLSQSVFEEFVIQCEVPSSSYLSTWQSNIRLPNSGIAYITTDPEPDCSQALGLFFALPRTHPEIGSELLHLWIAAIKPAYQGLDIFSILMDRVEVHARDCGHNEMTVCTHPKTYTKMYRILCKHGWQEVARRENGAKVLMKLSLS